MRLAKSSGPRNAGHDDEFGHAHHPRRSARDQAAAAQLDPVRAVIGHDRTDRSTPGPHPPADPRSPRTAGSKITNTYMTLRALLEPGLVATGARRMFTSGCWFVREEGMRLAYANASRHRRPWVFNPHSAHGLLKHTWLTNEIGRASRRRYKELGYKALKHSCHPHRSMVVDHHRRRSACSDSSAPSRLRPHNWVTTGCFSGAVNDDAHDSPHSSPNSRPKYRHFNTYGVVCLYGGGALSRR